MNFDGDINTLNQTPGLRTSTPAPQNALTFGLSLLKPYQVSPRMLAGLRQPRNPLAGLNNTPSITPLIETDTSGMTEEQTAARAIQQLLAARR
jgi:hypothetical protein